jgi:protein-arginine kinase activator protein McsA
MDRISCNITGTCHQPLMTNESLVNFGVVGCSNCTQSAIGAGAMIEAVLALAPAAGAGS